MTMFKKPVTIRGWIGILIRAAVAVMAVILLCWALLPTRIGIFNAGVMASVPVCICVLAAALFWNRFAALAARIWSVIPGRVVMCAVCGICAAVLVMFISASALMLHAAVKAPSKNAAVVVLGAGLNGNWPSLMLARRLDAAAKYLNDNPDSVCIVSGGQGPDEVCTEADAMHRYLVQVWNIDPNRLYKEEQSTTTIENIRFSKELMEREGLGTDAVIATQEFHQYRSQEMAREAGMTNVGPATCHTPWYLLECYWVREFAGISRYWLLGI